MKTILFSDDINLLTYWQKALSDSYEVLEDLEDV